MSALSMDRLERLNARARTRKFDLSAVDWTRKVDRGARWAPPGIGTLSRLPEHGLLDERESRRCNQLEAIGICEQFIWIEAEVAIPSLTRLMRTKPMPGPLGEAVKNFIEEEEKHVEMFWRLLERSEPSWYSRRSRCLFRLSVLERTVVSWLVSAPAQLLAWLPITVFAEERSLYFSRAYMRSKALQADRVDPLHARVHALHLCDEVRHCELDRWLVDRFHDSEARWKRRISATMFNLFMRRYAVGPSTSARVVTQLAREFPRLRSSVLPAFLLRLRSVAHDADLRARILSGTALPLTRTLAGTSLRSTVG